MDSEMRARLTTVSIAGSGQGTTTVTWRRAGTHGLIGAALRISLGDDWVVGDIELALDHLKRIAEAERSAPAAASP